MLRSHLEGRSSLRRKNQTKRSQTKRSQSKRSQAKRKRSRRLNHESLECRRLLTILPAGFTEELVGWASSASTMAIAPDGRVFVGQQHGHIEVIENDQQLDDPILELAVSEGGERGLLGITFDPQFESNNFLYVYYTTQDAPIHNRVSRFTMQGNSVIDGSEVSILDLEELGAINHNGGGIHFGSDDMLYVAVGDNAVSSNSQSMDTRFGKMLRIASDGSIPTDNPFYTTAVGDNRAIWSLGWRNPFSFAVQPGTGLMLVNDVGGGQWEEINEAVSGGNFGWPLQEGAGNDPAFINPVFAYPHDGPEPNGCAITGGDFYNPPVNQFGNEYIGQYFYSDFCGNFIHTLDPETGVSTHFADLERPAFSGMIDIETHFDGSLYYVNRNGGVYKIERPGFNDVPVILDPPQDISVPVNTLASFHVNAFSTPPISYQWQRNGADIAGAETDTLTLPSVTVLDNGDLFSAVVTGPGGSVSSEAATLTVINSQTPTATITSPLPIDTYVAGQTYQFSGTGTDPEDGQLAAEQFSWTVEFHHDQHAHPFLGPIDDVTGGEFTIPTTGELSANVWYRIHLTVEDSAGLTHSAFRDIHPDTVEITLETNPANLNVLLDGQPVTTPHTVESVVGIERSVSLLEPLDQNGLLLGFQNWSDGGSLSHTIQTPATDLTLTANLVSLGEVPVPRNSMWNYLDDGSNQGDAWRETVFDDSTWSAGAGQLGYGDTQDTVVSFGDDPDEKHITTYFRHQFNIANPANYSEIQLQLLWDDGAAVYLNGVELTRENLAADAAFDTTASGAVVDVEEETYFTRLVDLESLPAGTLRAGENVLAAEVHQAGERSSDIGFDAQLALRFGAPRVDAVVVNGGEQDTDDLPRGEQPSSWNQQRSSIRSIQVDFSQPVEVAASDFVLTNLGVDADVDPDTNAVINDQQIDVVGNSVTISFAADDLSDGVYELRILPSLTNNRGDALDGNSDGAGGDEYVMTGSALNRFYQFASDWNGDFGSSVFDFTVFSYWFSETTQQVGGLAPNYVDTNNDDGVSVFDFTAFADHFGQSVSFPSALANRIAELQIQALPMRDSGSDDSRMARAAVNDTAVDEILRNWQNDAVIDHLDWF
jgi:glucose/arabinose dehydrogenase